ncbi:hypothetical protein WLZ34_00105 [Thermogladius sp. KZ2Tp1]|uniref:hypothetical protein n=1 Tax=Thermogladius sp. KZ2Tp1 TaxID=3136289 RepID=UPI003DA9AAE5
MRNIVDSIREVHLQVKVVELGDVRVVVKEYGREPGILKWAFIKASTIPLQVYPFEVKPLNRLEREVRAFKELRGFSTPRVILVDYRDALIAREFVEGTNDVEVVKKQLDRLGEVFSETHNYGYSLGDTKLDNLVYSERGDEWYVIDCEQAVSPARPQAMIWDLLVFLTSYLFATLEKNVFALAGFREQMSVFLRSYLERSDNRVEIASSAGTYLVKLVSSLMLPYPLSRAFIEALRSSST